MSHLIDFSSKSLHNTKYTMSNYTQLQPDSSHQGAATVLCCNCGVPMDGSKGLVMCYDCIRLTVDITKGIPRESNVAFCRNCERYLIPPAHWVRAQLESRELLAICLKKLRGLNKVRLIDASFIWTEPHSRRIRIKVTVQGEAMTNTIIEQSFEVEYVVIATQCPDCARSYTPNTWNSTVQIRQKVPHKRTFLYLEQIILKHNAHLDTISIQETRDGLDFFYSQKNHAMKMIDFLSSVAPIRSKKSERLVSEDIHSGTSSYKFSFSVEIVPICRDDLVVLPTKVAHSLGYISRLVLCSKISNMIQFLDPVTLQTSELNSPAYWRMPFPALLSSTQLVEFIVLDVEPTGYVKGKYVQADITVCRESDLGVSENTYYVRCHLGGILHPGDSCLGYHITNSNFNSTLFESLDTDNVPEVVLVKKHYPRKSTASKTRKWKLKRMAKEYNEPAHESRQVKQEQEKAEVDYEVFLRELEEDEELRRSVNMYKSDVPHQAQKLQGDEMDNESDDVLEVGVDELLDEIDEMALEDQPMKE